MKALITGASSGIGLSFAKCLSSMGWDLILVARSKERLEYIKEKLDGNVKIIVMDISTLQKVKELYVLTRKENIDLLINNAGFGEFGEFKNTDLTNELNMIDTNIKALHVLTKVFLRDMIKKDSGYILNVASSAAFQPGGPLMVTYYATKSYVKSLTEGIWYELKKRKSKVVISCLCPGPVATNFNKVAGVEFSVKPLSSDFVAKYTLEKLFQEKMMIIPGFKMKCAKFFSRFVSDKFLLRTVYKIQKKKLK